jgi:hypothetical protein
MIYTLSIDLSIELIPPPPSSSLSSSCFLLFLLFLICCFTVPCFHPQCLFLTPFPSLSSYGALPMHSKLSKCILVLLLLNARAYFCHLEAVVWIRIRRIRMFLGQPDPHSGTEVVLVREGPRAGGGSSQRKKGSDYFTSPVKTMTLRDIK